MQTQAFGAGGNLRFGRTRCAVLMCAGMRPCVSAGVSMSMLMFMAMTEFMLMRMLSMEVIMLLPGGGFRRMMLTTTGNFF